MTAGLGMTLGLGAAAHDDEAAGSNPGLGNVPAFFQGGLGFTRVSEQQAPQVSEAEKEQAHKDLQRVLAHFTSAEELTGTASAADEADADADDANTASNKVFHAASICPRMQAAVQHSFGYSCMFSPVWLCGDKFVMAACTQHYSNGSGHHMVLAQVMHLAQYATNQDLGIAPLHSGL